MTRAAIYVRISQDRSGEGAGVQRQEADARQLAEREGWDVIEPPYVDNDSSAYSGKRRPAYERLLADMREGKVDALIAWHTDRLHRSPVELESFITLVQQTSVMIRTCQAGELDLTTYDGQMTARIVGAIARRESDHKSARIRRKRLEEAREGRRNGGGRRMFGYKAGEPIEENGKTRYKGGGIEIEPREAEAIRAAADAVLGGASTYSVARGWNEIGLLSPQGKRWTTGKVTALLRQPSLAGIRSYRRTGETFRGAWEPIISEDQHALLVQRLRPTGARHGGRRGLLSGLLRCAECGLPMTFSQDSPERWRYKCDRSAQGGCGLVSVAQGRMLEGAVLRLAGDLLTAEARATMPRDEYGRMLAPLFDALRESGRGFGSADIDAANLLGWARQRGALEGTKASSDRDDLLAKLRELDERDKMLVRMLGRGELSQPDFNLASLEVDEERRAAEAELAAVPGTSMLDLVRHIELVRRHRAGEALTLEERESLRSMIKAALPGGTIYVKPGLKFGRSFDGASRLEIRR